jgi:alkylated DNA repair dioxygenase AlkB
MMTDSLVALLDAKTPTAFAAWPTPVFAHASANARLFMVDKLFTPAECELIVQHLDTLPLEHQPKITMFGRVCRMRRSIGFFAVSGVAGYAYAGQMSRASALTPELAALLRFVERAFDTPTGYNGILINKYADGTDYISPHSDDERSLSREVGVVCLSFGATRTMDFKTRRAPFETKKVVIRSGSLMCMHGAEFQRTYTHGIKALGKSAPPCGVRYSLTLRVHKK